MLPFIAVTKPAENHYYETEKFQKRKKKKEKINGGTGGGGERVNLETRVEE